MSVQSSLYVQYSTLCLNSLHALHVISVKTYMYIILNVIVDQQGATGVQLMV